MENKDLRSIADALMIEMGDQLIGKVIKHAQHYPGIAFYTFGSIQELVRKYTTLPFDDPQTKAERAKEVRGAFKTAMGAVEQEGRYTISTLDMEIERALEGRIEGPADTIGRGKKDVKSEHKKNYKG